MRSTRHAGIVLGDSTVAPKEPGRGRAHPLPAMRRPARITERFWLASTDGPVEHIKTGCIDNHWLTPRAETLPAPRPTTVPVAKLAHA
jgi:hypothetical protein